MVVNEVDFKRALKSVSDSFKIPWLYNIEALFKGTSWPLCFFPTWYAKHPNLFPGGLRKGRCHVSVMSLFEFLISFLAYV